MIKTVATITALLFALPASAGDFQGRVQLKDADGVVWDGQDHRVWGIDAPECNKQKKYIQYCTRNGKKWAAGCDATNAMRSVIADRTMVCQDTGKKTYGRQVVKCWLDGEDFAATVVRMGWAFENTRYSKGYYTAEETEAKEAKRGIWAGTCEKPWDWRRANR